MSGTECQPDEPAIPGAILPVVDDLPETVQQTLPDSSDIDPITGFGHNDQESRLCWNASVRTMG